MLKSQMLKRCIACCLFLATLYTPLWAVVELPNDFTVKQRWLSLTRTFDIETDLYKIGTVHRRVFSWTTTYDFYGLGDILEASAKQRFFSLGAIFEVENVEGTPLGRVEEHILTFYHTFDIISPSEELLATAQLNFWRTKYTLTDPDNQDHIVATLRRPYFRLRDTWHVHIDDPAYFSEKKIDPTLFIVIMAFQTDVDHWKDPSLTSHSRISLPFQKPSSQKMKQLQVELAKYSKLEKIQETPPPEEEAIQEMETFTETYLDNMGIDLENEESLLLLLPLLYSSELTTAQKNTLCFMMKSRL